MESKTAVRYFLFDKEKKTVTEQEAMPSWMPEEKKAHIGGFISRNAGKNIFLYFCQTDDFQGVVGRVKELTVKELDAEFLQQPSVVVEITTVRVMPKRSLSCWFCKERCSLNINKKYRQ